MTKPNILLIMADEMQAAALSCAGHPLVQTPNLDRLAARGTRFTNAYTPSPICVPARAAFATGRYVHQTGYWDNAIAYDGHTTGWGHVLQQAGLSPVSVGKLHYRNETDATGFSHQIKPLHILDGVGQVWGSVRDPLPVSRNGGRMIGDVGAGLSKYNRYDMMVADQTVAWINTADRAEPWVVFSSFVAPHFPLIVPQEYLDLYPLEAVPLPALRSQDGYSRHPWLERMNAFQDNDAEFESDAERRLAIASYYALCSFVDAQIGKVLDALDASGQVDNTLVIFCSDHGETLGLRGRWGKGVLYGEAVRVPMIMAGPGVPAAQINATPVSLLDVAPTIVGALGLDAPQDWVGASLLGLMTSDDPGRIVFSEYHAVASPSGAFMVADARWKYHEYVGYEPELFDLNADPQETRNLAQDIGHAGIVARMQGHLHGICDPASVDRAAKADQNALIARFGGREAALTVGPKGASPVPA